MTPTTINRVHARRVWDSRGRPTVEAEIRLAGGAIGRGIAPAGASRGSREAVDLRDGGTRLGGLDVGAGGRQRQGADRPRDLRHGRAGPGGYRREADRARWHAQQGEARRQRHGGGVARRGARRCARARHAAVAISRRRRSGSAADARGPDLRRRRACRTAHRHPGPDGDAGRRLDLRRRDRDGRRNLSRRGRA